jgi:hypothetical protein
MTPRPVAAVEQPPRRYTVPQPTAHDFEELLHAYLEHVDRNYGGQDPVWHWQMYGLARLQVEELLKRVFREHERTLPPVRRPYLAAVPDLEEDELP